METIVPLISTRCVGPLGVMHLPRLWLKVLLHATGRLPEGYRHGTGGADETTLANLGLDRDAFIAFVESERPDYLACEAWVRTHAKNLDPESIAKHNEIIKREKPEAMAAAQRAYIGIDDPTLRNNVILNDLDDWKTLHAQVTTGALPPLAASSLNAVLCELLKELLDGTRAQRASIALHLPAHGFELTKPAAEAKNGVMTNDHPAQTIEIFSNGELLARIAVDGDGAARWGEADAELLEATAARAKEIIAAVASPG